MKKTCNVKNRSSGRVVYRLPEDNIRREFYPREEKKNIPVSELTKLSQRPGGRELIYNYLQIDDPEIIYYLINGEIAPEYWFNEETLPDWMDKCSLAEFKDALDFAPQGVKDLIKKYAVSKPLNDYNKRTAIKEQLGFDVDSVIRNIANDSEEKSKEISESKPARSRRVPIADISIENKKVISVD